jgi:broad specificity phosphatase PhoE
VAAAAPPRYAPPVSTTTRLFLIRHALVEPSARTTMYGTMDVGLCELALRQEAATYRWLAARLPQPARWIVTPLSRTRATAAAIFAAGYPETPLDTRPALIEQALGELEGLPHDSFFEKLRHPPHPFWSIAAHECPPGGESFHDVVARVGPELDRIVAEHAGGDHGNPQRHAHVDASGTTREEGQGHRDEHAQRHRPPDRVGSADPARCEAPGHAGDAPDQGREEAEQQTHQTDPE